MELRCARCAGLDVHKDTVVACVRVEEDGRVNRKVKTFGTMTIDLIMLQAWLEDERERSAKPWRLVSASG